MKKFFTLILSFTMLTGASFAQSYWLNYANSINTWKGTTGIKTSQVLFPDTLPKAFVNNNHTFMPYVYAGYSKVEFNQMGNVLDVLSPAFSNADGVNWDSNTTYKIDSMGLEYEYIRKHPDNTIVDTLIVYLYSNLTTADLPLRSFTTGASNHGSDTVFYFEQQYDYVNHKPVASDIITIKVPLNDSDTSNGSTSRTKYFATPDFNADSGKKVACAISFKPGYSYNNNDTITWNKNYFSFVSKEERGSNTFPTYAKYDGNVSSLIMPYQRYNYDPGYGINGIYIDSYWWASPWQFEHHMIYYHVTSTSTGGTTGIENRTRNNGVKLYQNKPNPFNATSLIGYELEKQADVHVEIFDLSGRKLFSYDKMNQTSGYHSITVDVSLIPKGVYFYTLKTGEVSLVKKMIVTE